MARQIEKIIIKIADEEQNAELLTNDSLRLTLASRIAWALKVSLDRDKTWDYYITCEED